MQELRNACVLLPEQISDKGQRFISFYAFFIFVSLFLIKLAKHFENNDEIVSVATVCVDLITFFVIAMIFSFSAFIIRHVVAVKAKYAKLYYKNMLP